jgi:hypothetical protein
MATDLRNYRRELQVLDDLQDASVISWLYRERVYRSKTVHKVPSVKVHFWPIAAYRGGDRCGFCTEGCGDRLLSARQSGDPVMVGYWMTPDDEANGSSG